VFDFDTVSGMPFALCPLPSAALPSCRLAVLPSCPLALLPSALCPLPSCPLALLPSALCSLLSALCSLLSALCPLPSLLYPVPAAHAQSPAGDTTASVRVPPTLVFTNTIESCRATAHFLAVYLHPHKPKTLIDPANFDNPTNPTDPLNLLTLLHNRRRVTVWLPTTR
jgi:hypothetical protein